MSPKPTTPEQRFAVAGVLVSLIESGRVLARHGSPDAAHNFRLASREALRVADWLDAHPVKRGSVRESGANP